MIPFLEPVLQLKIPPAPSFLLPLECMSCLVIQGVFSVLYQKTTLVMEEETTNRHPKKNKNEKTKKIHRINMCVHSINL